MPPGKPPKRVRFRREHYVRAALLGLVVPLVLAVAMPRVFANQSRLDLTPLEQLAALEGKIQSVAASAGLQRSGEVQRDLDRLFAIRDQGSGFTGLVGFGSGVLGGICLSLLYLNSLRGERRALRANLATLLVIVLLVGVNLVAVRHARVEAANSLSGSTATLKEFMSKMVLAGISARDESLARQLLQFTGTLDARDASGDTALHLAATRGMNALVQDILRQRKLDPDASAADSATAIMRAAATAHPQVVSTLIAAKSDVNARDDQGRAPIHFAAESRRTDIVRMLLDAGADIDAQDGSGRTALAIAYTQGDHELFAALIHSGAQVGQSGEGARLAHEATAEAIRAIERGREDDAKAGAGEMERLKLLLNQGADPNGILKDEGTPLHRVSRAVAALPESSRRTARLGVLAAQLLDAGAEPFMEAGMGFVPYDITHAARFGHTNRVEEFCERDAALVSRAGLYNKTALVIAVESNQIDVLRVLLKHGAELNAWVGAGRSAIESAVIHGSDELVLMLLRNGFATPRERSPIGGPLHLAAKEGRTALLEPAVKAGYRIDDKDSRGNTPLHLASAAGHTEFAVALLGYGADPLTWNNSGETALSLADSNGHKALHTRLKRTTERPLKSR